MSKRLLCLRLIRANWLLFSTLVVGNVCTVMLAPLGLGFLIQLFFQKMTAAQPELRELILITIIMLALAFARMAAFLATMWVQVTSEYIVVGVLWRSILENLLRGFGAQVLPVPAGEVLNRLRDDGIALATFFSAAVQGTSFFGGSITSMIVMFHSAPDIAAAVVAPMLMTTGLVMSLKRRSRNAAIEERQASARVASLMGDIFTGIESVQGAGAEERFFDEFCRRNAKRKAAIVRDRVLLAAIREGMGTGCLLGVGGMLFVATYRMREGSFGVGEFAFFAHLIGYVAFGFESLTNVLAIYGRLDVPSQRLDALMASMGGGGVLGRAPRPPRVPHDLRYARFTPPKAPADRLRVLSGVGMTYVFEKEQKPAIDCVSLELTPGTLTLVLGAAGAGKSTLLRCMVGQLPLHAGRLLWNGEPIVKPQQFFQPPICSVCPQTPHLFSASVRRNIGFGQSLSKTELEHALWASVLDQDVASRQLNLEAPVGYQGKGLSGGQLQRVGAARMFARRAQLYVFDDVTRSLDRPTELLFWRRLSHRLDEGAACLVASHSQAALERADTIIVMVAGKVAARGPLSKLVLDYPELMRDVMRETAHVSTVM